MSLLLKVAISIFHISSKNNKIKNIYIFNGAPFKVYVASLFLDFTPEIKWSTVGKSSDQWRLN